MMRDPQPEEGIGKTIGVVYIKICRTTGMALPMSLYNIPKGVRNSPIAVPARISERNAKGKRRRLSPG